MSKRKRGEIKKGAFIFHENDYRPVHGEKSNDGTWALYYHWRGNVFAGKAPRCKVTWINERPMWHFYHGGMARSVHRVRRYEKRHGYAHASSVGFIKWRRCFSRKVFNLRAAFVR